MKQKILELLKEKREINITDFHNLIPESKGKYAMYMPVKKGYNPNMLWMANVTQEFIIAFNELMMDEVINWKPVDILFFITDGSPLYNVKLCKENYVKKQTECWMPIVITLKQ